jgi:hypothetical protein
VFFVQYSGGMEDQNTESSKARNNPDSYFLFSNEDHICTDLHSEHESPLQFFLSFDS